MHADTQLVALQRAARVHDSAMHELVRQLSQQCYEHGEVLSGIWHSQSKASGDMIVRGAPPPPQVVRMTAATRRVGCSAGRSPGADWSTHQPPFRHEQCQSRLQDAAGALGNGPRSRGAASSTRRRWRVRRTG